MRFAALYASYISDSGHVVLPSVQVRRKRKGPAIAGPSGLLRQEDLTRTAALRSRSRWRIRRRSASRPGSSYSGASVSSIAGVLDPRLVSPPLGVELHRGEVGNAREGDPEVGGLAGLDLRRVDLAVVGREEPAVGVVDRHQQGRGRDDVRAAVLHRAEDLEAVAGRVLGLLPGDHLERRRRRLLGRSGLALLAGSAAGFGFGLGERRGADRRNVLLGQPQDRLLLLLHGRHRSDRRLPGLGGHEGALVEIDLVGADHRQRAVRHGEEDPPAVHLPGALGLDARAVTGHQPVGVRRIGAEAGDADESGQAEQATATWQQTKRGVCSSRSELLPARRVDAQRNRGDEDQAGVRPDGLDVLRVVGVPAARRLQRLELVPDEPQRLGDVVGVLLARRRRPPDSRSRSARRTAAW